MDETAGVDSSKIEVVGMVAFDAVVGSNVVSSAVVRDSGVLALFEMGVVCVRCVSVVCGGG